MLSSWISSWRNVRTYVELQKIVYDGTLNNFGFLFVIANLCFQELWTTENVLNDTCLSNNIRTNTLDRNVKNKYDKYWVTIDNFNFMINVAFVFDLWYKIKVILGARMIYEPTIIFYSVKTPHSF